MKRTINAIILLAAVVFTFSCTEDNEIVTGINPDGSCYREFYSSVDSAFLSGDYSEEHNPFPVEISSDWEITYNQENQEAIIRCDYRSVEEMEKTFRLKPSHSWSDLDVRYRLDKKFRWFYTYYIYSETYPKIETSFTPIDQFMTNEEAGFWFSGEPNLAVGMNGIEAYEYTERLQEKYTQWITYNYWITLYELLVVNYDRFKLTVSKEGFMAQRDELFTQVNFDDIVADNDSYIARKLDETFHTNNFTAFFEEENSPVDDFGEQFWSQDFMRYLEHSFTYKLRMPGKILKADNAVNQNDTLVWRLTAYRMMYDNYTIKAESRKMNVWAYSITGIIILLVTGFLLRRRP